MEVLQCEDNEVAYSYEMNADIERTIIPCMGRYLPMGCYVVNVKFLDARPIRFREARVLLYISILLVLSALIYYYIRQHASSRKDTTNQDIPYAEIGSFQFYPEQNKLVKAATEISLSKKECELLAIFVARPNQIIKRDELSKKVWEDNGVVVGRSLDTYISKLRKKLKDDTSIKLTNVHGVGYKLEID